MREGVICARHYRTRQPVRVRWRDGILAEIEPATVLPKSNIWVAPALVDVQINGFAGVDFQKDGLREEDLFRAVAGLRDAGCARFLLTLITDPWESLISKL